VCAYNKLGEQSVCAYNKLGEQSVCAYNKLGEQSEFHTESVLVFLGSHLTCVQCASPYCPIHKRMLCSDNRRSPTSQGSPYWLYKKGFMSILIQVAYTLAK